MSIMISTRTLLPFCVAALVVCMGCEESGTTPVADAGAADSGTSTRATSLEIVITEAGITESGLELAVGGTLTFTNARDTEDAVIECDVGPLDAPARTIAVGESTTFEFPDAGSYLCTNRIWDAGVPNGVRIYVE